jgi:hypothetical protein
VSLPQALAGTLTPLTALTEEAWEPPPTWGCPVPLLWDATRGLPTTAGSPRPLLACGVGGPNWSDGSVAVLLPCRRSPPTRTRRTGRHLFLLSYRRCATAAISDGADRGRWPTVVTAVTETATARRETETCYRAVTKGGRVHPVTYTVLPLGNTILLKKIIRIITTAIRFIRTILNTNQ